jgi:hypothetical protein
LIKEIKSDITDNNLKPGIQQFRLVIARSRLNQYVNQEAAARIWLSVIRGRDEKLPDELVSDNNKKRKRDEKAEDKAIRLQPEEEEKEGHLKR